MSRDGIAYDAVDNGDRVKRLPRDRTAHDQLSGSDSPSASQSVKHLPRGDAHDQAPSQGRGKFALLPRGDAHDQLLPSNSTGKDALPRTAHDAVLASESAVSDPLCRGTKKDGQRCALKARYAWELCGHHIDQARDLCRAQVVSERNAYCTQMALADTQFCSQHRSAAATSATAAAAAEVQ